MWPICVTDDKPEIKDLRSNPPTKVKLPPISKPSPPPVKEKPNKVLPKWVKTSRSFCVMTYLHAKTIEDLQISVFRGVNSDSFATFLKQKVLAATLSGAASLHVEVFCLQPPVAIVPLKRMPGCPTFSSSVETLGWVRLGLNRREQPISCFLSKTHTHTQAGKYATEKTKTAPSWGVC